MQKQTLVKAIAEAERFLEKAKAAEQELIKEASVRARNLDWYFPSGKILAACKRASLDLTRVLSDMRQNR